MFKSEGARLGYCIMEPCRVKCSAAFAKAQYLLYGTLIKNQRYFFNTIIISSITL